MVPPARVLVIGLDACDPGTMLRLATEGRAPALAHLLTRAARATVVNPPGLYVGSLWPTFVTGLPPTVHGYYCWEEVAAGGYEHRTTDPRSRRGKPFWDVLSRAGRRVAVVDVPHTWVEGPLNGIQLVEWGCHDRHYGLHSWPPDLAADVERRFGLHPALGVDAHAERQFAADDRVHRAGAHRDGAETKALVDCMLAGVDRKAALSLHLLDRGDWDLFLTVFGEAHAIGHQCWHLHDPGHPRHDAPLAAEIGDPVARVYERLDAAVGAHLERVDADTSVIVLLSHGMGRHFDGTLTLEPLLRRLDLAADGREPGPGPLKRVWAGVPRRARRRLMPVAARLLRRRLRQGRVVPAPVPAGGCGCGIAPLTPDEAVHRRWFAVPNNDAHGGIRFNVTGREPAGAVAPEDVDALSAALVDDLLDVVNVETGEPLVESVLRTADVYPREGDDQLPDLLVLWNRSSPVTTVYSPKTGLVVRPYAGWRTGDHTPEGLLLATAPSLPAASLDPVPLTDLAPTICSWLGVHLPDVEGRPVTSLAGRG